MSSTSPSGAVPAVQARGNRRAAFLRYLDIVLFKAYADLRVERSRTYLGMVWWTVEPLVYMAVFWVVFVHVMGTRDENTVSFLLVGIIFWQWFKSCISHGSASVLEARGLIQQVKLPPVIFPLVTIATDTVKFSVVLALLILFLWWDGHANTQAMLSLPFLLLVEFALLSAVTIWLAAFVPFVPDLRFVAENILLALMFLSGIFYDIRNVSAEAQPYFEYNPIALLIQQIRLVLLEGQWPNWSAMLIMLVISLALCLLGAHVTERLRRFYPKLPR